MLDRLDRRLRKLSTGARVRIAREQITPLRALNRQIDQLHCELAELLAAHHPNLIAELGCGALTAAILIGPTAGNQQFRNEASFAMKTGTPPVPCSSGQRSQHRLNRGGEGQLNHALHIIASRAPSAIRTPSSTWRARRPRQDQQGRAALPQAPPRSPLSTSSSPSLPPTRSKPPTISRPPNRSRRPAPTHPRRPRRLRPTGEKPTGSTPPPP
jgi:hypothetical protein